MPIRPAPLYLTALLIAATLSAATKQKPQTPSVKPRFDGPDVPFRMAPMPPASRSVSVSVLPDLHLAFDTENCRFHTAWSGKGLHLLGPQYSFAKRPFISTNAPGVLWTMPPWPSWSEADPSEKLDPVNPKYHGISTRGGNTTFLYDLLSTRAGNVRIRETPRGAIVGDQHWLIRKIEVGPSDAELWFAPHSEFSDAKIVDAGHALFANRLNVRIRGTESGSFFIRSSEVDYQEEVFTETGAEKGNPTLQRKGLLFTAWIRVPARSKPVTIEVASFTGIENSAAIDPARIFDQPSPRGSTGPATRRPAVAQFAFSQASTPHYRAEPFPLPKDLEMLVTGMDFLPNGDLAVCTWPGDICVVHQATGRPAEASYSRFATGLCEPMGLVAKDGAFYVGMKNELAKIADTDGDGAADLFERINANWSYTGHYNAFSYGPVLDRHGDFVLANAGHSGRWDARYSGWAFGISANGANLTPIGCGLREPNGIGVFGPDRDIFVTDNQGAWIGECRLDHIAPGKFHGHPSGWPAKKDHYGKAGKMDPPAVWFPYSLARSTTGIAEIPAGFGPFTGQLVVGDFQNALVTRVMLEKVDGEYQGAVWPFLKRFASGVNRLVFGPDNRLYVGGCQRTWASIAPKEAAIERVSFTGKTPFEVKSVHARQDGFELEFTSPVDPATAGDPASYDMLQYTLRYHSKYGSPQLDHDGKENSATAITITGARVHGENLKVRLTVAGWKTGYVTMVRGLDVRSADGGKLVNDTFWYTLNRLPKE